WSQDGRGELCDVEELAGMFRELYAQGCHNWNLVSPTPWLAQIRESMQILKKEGISLPVVYNTSSYELVEVLEEYDDLADIYLADLRYSRKDTAREGSGVGDYVERARSALQWMWRRRGALSLDSDGVAMSGVICRMLILPGYSEEVVENLEWLADTVGTDISISMMAQYVPTGRAASMSPWHRNITKSEYMLAIDAMKRLGFDKGWVQDFEGATPDELIGFKMKE
ncbi:MAG: radical SAM protein, partial [Kiritimatiellae bacterium]|nr:radical SAM protein [Kiritimatiellia bacterium]